MVAVNLTVNSSILSTEYFHDAVYKNNRLSEKFMYLPSLQKQLTETEIFENASQIISNVWESVGKKRKWETRLRRN